MYNMNFGMSNHASFGSNKGIGSKDYTMFNIETAIELAAKYHSGQKRLNGEPYIYHLLRVMLKMKTEEERIAAVLHDILEDTDVTEEDLLKMGCDEHTVTVISHLSRMAHESYEDYIKSLNYNEIPIKIEDLQDNLNIADLGHALTDKDSKRITKYIKALNYLKSISKTNTTTRGV